MDTIKKIKVKQQDGSMSDFYNIGCNAQNVDFTNGYSLDQIVGNINPDEDGSIEEQLNKEVVSYNLEKPSSELRLNQLLGIAKTYYDNRLDANGDNVFEYGHTTALDDEYTNTGEHKREIDCSAFIGLILRGITFENSPYAILQTHESDSGDSGDDDDSGQTEPETDDDPTQDQVELQLGDYPWAIDLYQYKRKLVNQMKTVRSASQLCQLFEESGWEFEYADNFANIQRGDIIFYAKMKDGDWAQPNRYKHVSHVAIVSSVLDNTGDTYNIGEQYPYKHTMYEVSTFGHIVLNTCLEKRTPNRIVMVCRPKLGFEDYKVSGGASRIQGSGSSVNSMFKPGFMYLTSSTTIGLPANIANGTGYALKVDVSYNPWGKVYSMVQTLYNTRGSEIYVRCQYCYSNGYKPSTTKWKPWVQLITESISI